QERHRTLVEVNRTELALPDASLAELFERQVALTPDAPALACENTTLSYAELNTRANHLAHHLTTRGIRPGDTVAVLLQRSPDTVTTVLALAKTGATYIPLDNRYPADRIRLVLDETRTKLLITDTTTELDTTTPEFNPEHTPQGEDPGNPHHTVHPDDAAYIMYTSGSTGRPKGVIATHRNITALALDPRFHPTAHHRVLLHSPTAFDASTYEIWVPLLNGNT
uniref:AMP-binding protein n=1 Tax=Streptomyces sp. NRRL WC-3742 TaxID=1463934 RepID=UPI0005647DFB